MDVSRTPSPQCFDESPPSQLYLRLTRNCGRSLMPPARRGASTSLTSSTQSARNAGRPTTWVKDALVGQRNGIQETEIRAVIDELKAIRHRLGEQSAWLRIASTAPYDSPAHPKESGFGKHTGRKLGRFCYGNAP